MERAELAPYLQTFVRARYGSWAQVRGLRGFAGSHGGLTYGFEVFDRRSEARCEALVIRLSPPGVRRSGNTDVIRQVPLLRVLRAQDFPVPRIRYSGEDDGSFPSAYVIFEHLEGRSFVVWDPDPSFDRSDAAVAPLWLAAARLLARVHRFDWQTHLADWEEPTPIEGEVRRWDSILARAAEPAWVRLGEGVRELLLRRPPPPSPVGLLHGDCQPGNILYGGGGEVLGLLDWELSAIGAQLYDLGWTLMIGDRESWHPQWCPVNPLPASALIEVYAAGVGREPAGIAWYRALAGYRMAVVTGLYTKLHREGRRRDPAWEKMALAVPSLYGRAAALLRGAAC